MALLEGVLVFALLAGVLLGVLLLGQWGTRLQYSQMGARLLTFNAGDTSLAKFSRIGDSAIQTPSTTEWDTLTDSVPSVWLNVMFDSLSNDRLAGRVKGTQRGRLPSQGRSMFDFSSASMGYFSNASAASNPWADDPAEVYKTFLGISYWVGYHQDTTMETLSSVPVIPTSIEVAETIFGRLGIVR